MPGGATVESASSWRDLAQRSPRSAARSAAISAAAAALRLTGRLDSLLRRPRVQVLILHHVFPDEEAGFRRLLEFLTRQHRFITYGEAGRRAEAGGDQVNRPYLTFTFDDGLKNCLRAAQIMEEFGARACFFICPSIIGQTDPSAINAFCQRLEIPPVEFLSWDDLSRLRDAGHEIGGHTMTHPNLAAITPQQAQDEIGGSFEAIRRNLGGGREGGGGAEHFAWTFGGFHHMTAEAARIVYKAGYRTCASGVRGAHGPLRANSNQPICIRRDHIVAGRPLSHAQYFLAKASRGLSPNSGDWPARWNVTA